MYHYSLRSLYSVVFFAGSILSSTLTVLSEFTPRSQTSARIKPAAVWADRDATAAIGSLEEIIGVLR